MQSYFLFFQISLHLFFIKGFEERREKTEFKHFDNLKRKNRIQSMGL